MLPCNFCHPVDGKSICWQLDIRAVSSLNKTPHGRLIDRCQAKKKRKKVKSLRLIDPGQFQEKGEKTNNFDLGNLVIPKKR